jgi:hypothetical protein
VELQQPVTGVSAEQARIAGPPEGIDPSRVGQSVGLEAAAVSGDDLLELRVLDAAELLKPAAEVAALDVCCHFIGLLYCIENTLSFFTALEKRSRCP